MAADYVAHDANGRVHVTEDLPGLARTDPHHGNLVGTATHPPTCWLSHDVPVHPDVAVSSAAGLTCAAIRRHPESSSWIQVRV